jgi:hypothetical protein
LSAPGLIPARSAAAPTDNPSSFSNGECLALRPWQHPERVGERRLERFPLQGHLRQVVDRGLPGAPAAAPAGVIRRRVARDGEEPGLEGARGVIGVPRTVQVDERVLVDVGQVLGVGQPPA